MNMDQIGATAESKSAYLKDTSCIKIYVAASAADSSATRIIDVFQDAIDKRGLRAKAVRTGSFGCYDLEPIVMIDNPGLYSVLCRNATPNTALDLFSDCFNGGIRGKDWLLCRLGEKRVDGIPHISELPLFNQQNRIALRNCGWIDPKDIHHYMMRGQGYTGLSLALSMKRKDLMEVFLQTALTGRRELGCSLAGKWSQCRESGEGDKYVICDGVGSDPGTLTSRLLLEGDPHSVLEGLLISAYAVGASHCFLYVAEDADSRLVLSRALEQMKEYNLLGVNILDSQFSAQIEIKQVPKSCVSGYGRELFRCVEERQSLPHMCPSYPGIREFFGRPALITNPESMSALSAILVHGLEGSRETTVVTLSGSLVHKYTVEVSSRMGICSIIEKLGGGVPNGKAIKAVQLGGPLGEFVAPDSLDLPIGRWAVEESDANAGSGHLDVLDTDSSIVDSVRDLMSYIQPQSCGRCVFCREGSLQILTILEDISEKRGKLQDLDLLIELGEVMRDSSLCPFGRAAPNPVLSSIRLFRNEYNERVAG